MSINFSGDLLWHNTLWQSAELDHPGAGRDFAPQLEGVRDLVSAADIAICHSEVPFAPAGGPYRNYPSFAVPPEIAPALATTGWDVCTTASNHALDAGMDGLERTIAAHRAVGIATAGTHATEAESHVPPILTSDQGLRVAVVSSTYGTNGIPLPREAPWAVSLLDARDTLERAARARGAGADVVVVHMHAGDEYSPTPNRQQVEFATAVTASPDVDLVIGQHAHVVQPITRLNGTWVAYGAGNLIAQSGPAQPRTYDGYLATFTFTEGEGGTFSARQPSSRPP